MASQIPELAMDVLQTLSRWKVPTNPFEIAHDEQIELAPGNYGEGFDARIEYIPAVKRFVIYYRLSGPGRPEGRVRFSIAHELGHFYIPEHRQRLLKGDLHNSQSDFRSKDPHELEADEFAANLLMPKELFVAEVRRFRQRVCTLAEICKMADQRFHTSVTSTARRYCQCDIEACSIVVSKNGIVRWAMHSEDMRARNMKYVPFGKSIPAMSKTASLLESIHETDVPDPVEGAVDPEVWFEKPYYRKGLWEEAMLLGNTGLVLTYITLEDSE
jgi:Zn-dependent peptidase ImmA (M78 family)